MIDELEFIFPLNGKPKINRLERVGHSEPEYKKWCELEEPIRSTLQPEVEDSRHMYSRYAQISSNSAFLLYITQDRRLLQYKLSDIRKKVIKPECIATNLEDFCWDNKGVVTLLKNGEVCTEAGKATGRWVEQLDVVWNVLTKFDNDWVAIGWRKSTFKHVFVRIDVNGTWKSTKYLDCSNIKTEQNSNLL